MKKALVIALMLIFGCTSHRAESKTEKSPKTVRLVSVTYIGNTPGPGPIYWQTVWKFNHEVEATPNSEKFGDDSLRLMQDNYLAAASSITQYSTKELLCTHPPSTSDAIPDRFWISKLPTNIIFPNGQFVRPTGGDPEGSGPVQ